MANAEDESSGWQLTESDPGVFTELLKTLGVPLIVDDLYSLDSESLAALQPLHALIFLFKWLPNSDEPSSRAGQLDPDFLGFFAHQVVHNACATLAVLNALGNIPSLQKGEQLAELLEFSSGLDPQTRGIVITGSDWLREAHNALSPPSAVSLDGLGLPRTSEDAYHFVVYLPVHGSLFELDGLRQYAVNHGAVPESREGWTARAREVIEARIETYPIGALEFSLLALRDDPLPSLQSQLVQLQSSGNTTERGEVMIRLANETSKRERWAFENSLRRHNHIGLAHALLLSLAKAGKLDAAKENAKKLMKEQIEARKKQGKSSDE